MDVGGGRETSSCQIPRVYSGLMVSDFVDEQDGIPLSLKTTASDGQGRIQTCHSKHGLCSSTAVNAADTGQVTNLWTK